MLACHEIKYDSVNIDTLRKQFPFIVQNPEYAYLDNAATSHVPLSVMHEMQYFETTYRSNIHRAVHRFAEKATLKYEDSRKKVADFINAEDASEVVFTHGTTEGLNLAAHSLGELLLEAGDEILLTELEHHSNLVPWQLIAKRYGAVLRFISFDEHGRLKIDELDTLLNDKTKIVSVTHVSNLFGTVSPLDTIIEKAHEAGAVVVVDGAQAVAHMKVDVQDLDADFYAFSGHKMYGPTGIGVLYGKKELLIKMPPFLGGGEMISSVWLDRAKYNEVPYKFEAGTSHIAGAVGLGAAIDFINSIGINTINCITKDITYHAVKYLKQVKQIILYGETDDPGSLVSFNVGSFHPHDVAQYLDDRHVAVRSGHHCAHPAIRRLGVPATTRASFAFYNTKEEVEKLVSALKHFISDFSR